MSVRGDRKRAIRKATRLRIQAEQKLERGARPFIGRRDEEVATLGLFKDVPEVFSREFMDESFF